MPRRIIIMRIIPAVRESQGLKLRSRRIPRLTASDYPLDVKHADNVTGRLAVTVHLDLRLRSRTHESAGETRSARRRNVSNNSRSSNCRPTSGRFSPPNPTSRKSRSHHHLSLHIPTHNLVSDAPCNHCLTRQKLYLSIRQAESSLFIIGSQSHRHARIAIRTTSLHHLP